MHAQVGTAALDPYAQIATMRSWYDADGAGPYGAK